MKHTKYTKSQLNAISKSYTKRKEKLRDDMIIRCNDTEDANIYIMINQKYKHIGTKINKFNEYLKSKYKE